MYLPKNKIKTNLFSNGTLVYAYNNQAYTGHYHKLYNGRMYSGKTPYDKPCLELIEFKQAEEPPEGTKELELDYGTSNIMNYNYSVLKKINTKVPSKTEIKSIISFPTEKDYELGIFIRYFLVKINENIYYEINKDTFDKIKAKDNQYNWELYIPFILRWDIAGDPKEVANVNKNIVGLIEYRLKRDGLSKFLNFNYLKFFKFTPQNDLYTNGDLLVSEDGSSYSGDYHIEEDGYFSYSSPNKQYSKRLFLKMS